MDFDPITGNLWDTENGVVFGDEINLIHPGFNSGWNKNDIFVGDIINGNIYHFDLNKERTELLLPPNSPLLDKVVSSNETRYNNEIIFGKGFGGVTDIEVGLKDGYLYILTFSKGQG